MIGKNVCVSSDAVARRLSGDESIVFFEPGDEFEGVDAEWLLPRLRLNPEVGSIDLDWGSLTVFVEDEEFDLTDDLESVLGAGPHDSDLCRVEDPDGATAECRVIGGWLETVAPDIAHELTWIGEGCDLDQVTEEFTTTWLATWGNIEATDLRSRG